MRVGVDAGARGALAAALLVLAVCPAAAQEGWLRDGVSLVHKGADAELRLARLRPGRPALAAELHRGRRRGGRPRTAPTPSCAASASGSRGGGSASAFESTFDPADEGEPSRTCSATYGSRGAAAPQRPHEGAVSGPSS